MRLDSRPSAELLRTCFRGSIHYHLRSPLTIKAGPKAEAGGRRRRAVEVLSGPDRWSKQRTGLAGSPLRQRPIGCGQKPCREVSVSGERVERTFRTSEKVPDASPGKITAGVELQIQVAIR